MEKVSTRKQRIEFTVSDKDLQIIETRATKEGKKVATYCRDRVLRTVKNTSRKDAMIEAITKELGLPAFRLLEISRRKPDEILLSMPAVVAALREFYDILNKARKSTENTGN